MKHYYFLLFVLWVYPVNIHAQFWDGVLMGIANAMQNYNYNQQFRTNAPSNRTTTKTKSEREKKLMEEDDGFSWYKIHTWNGTDFVNCGAQDINGKPLISERYDFLYYSESSGFFYVKKNGKEGLYSKDGGCICEAKYNEIFVHKKDDGTYIEFKDNVGIGIMNDKGRVIIPSSSLYKSILYLSDGFEYKNDAGNWIAFDMDIHGNHVCDNNMGENITKTQTIARTDNSNNSNNNKFWYDKYANGKMDSQGNPIKTSLKYMYPCEGANMFEIEFVYKDDNSMPVSVYLNEIAEGGKIVKSELIAAPFKSVASSVKYKTNSVNIFSPKYHINISSSGDVIIYDTNKGSYANGNTRYFKAGIAEPIYNARYEVLIENLKKYF